jgi:hypothetical protein
MSRAIVLLVSAGLCLGAGCQTVLTAPSEAALDKLLRPANTAPDSVALEIFEARVPLDQDERVEGLWQYVDEQCLDADLRRRLLANGLRAGVVGGTPPDELSDLLGLQCELSENAVERVISPQSAVPRVTRRVVQVNRLEQRMIQASDTRAEVDVLLSEDGRLHGNTYRQVEGRYELRAESAPGQRISVSLVPELHHGELRNRYAGSDQGVLMMTPSRERQAFEWLTMRVELSPGELLVIGCLPDADASLGAVLQTVESKGRRERKFVLVRAMESPASEILAEE